MNKTEFLKRNRKEITDKLRPGSLIILYSGRELQRSLDENYPFYVENNYFYTTGLNEPEGILILAKTKEGEVKEKILIPKADKLKEKWVGFKYSPQEASQISGIEDIGFTENLNDEIKEYVSNQYDLFIDKSQPIHSRLFSEEELKNFNSVNDLSDDLFKLRLIKKDYEIDNLKEAAKITNKALNQLIGEIRPGIYEYELSSLFEYLIKKYGADSISFETIAASGEDGPILHYVNNDKILKRGDLILFDLGARLNGYCADVSRTYPISGEFSIIQEKFYRVVLETQKELIKNYKRGTKLKDLQELTKKLFIENLQKENIPLPEGGIDEWYYHSIGHSLGLDTHDGINRDLVLEDGMVITCEPGLYAREYGIGIRIEDDILINGDDPIILTKDIPKEINEIKRLMQ